MPGREPRVDDVVPEEAAAAEHQEPHPRVLLHLARPTPPLRTVLRVTPTVLAVAPESFRGLLTEEYEALVGAGLLTGQPVELLEGVLVEVAPISPEHASTVTAIADALRAQMPSGWRVREEKPLRVPPSSEPEPDVAVVRDTDLSRAHPSTALLVVEISVSSAPVDLEVKPGVYAAAEVDEYWVVDVPARRVHVHRQRRAGGYDDVQELPAGPLRSGTAPVLEVDVAAALPPQ